MFCHYFLPHLSATSDIIHPGATNVNYFLKKLQFFLAVFLEKTKMIMIPT